MGAATAALGILGVLWKLVKQIHDDIKAGVPKEEIRQRLADPHGVGQELLDAVEARADLFEFPGDKDPSE